jgi:outer membrane translocation and assembly module TamA
LSAGFWIFVFSFSALRADHDQEKRLMKESQQTEINEIQRKADNEKTKIQNPADKQKLVDQAKSRIAELKKKHEEEKSAMTERQKAEETKTKHAPVRKKIDKN